MLSLSHILWICGLIPYRAKVYLKRNMSHMLLNNKGCYEITIYGMLMINSIDRWLQLILANQSI